MHSLKPNKFAYSFITSFGLIPVAFFIFVKAFALAFAVIIGLLIITSILAYIASSITYTIHANRVETIIHTPIYTHSQTVWIASILDAQLTQTPLDKLFGTGTLAFTPATGEPIKLTFVSNPTTVLSQISGK